MIKLYGVTRSRTSRVLWMLNELGVPFERVLTNPHDGGTRKAEYLAVNPNGHVPALEDDGVILCESVAINLYLADKYGKLWPKTPEGRGRCYMWSVWSMTELEKHALTALQHRALLPEADRDEAVWREAGESAQKPLAVLNGALAGKDYLLDNEFTVADLNVSSICSWAMRAKVPLDAHPNLKAWLSRCMERPAQQKVVAEMRAA